MATTTTGIDYTWEIKRNGVVILSEHQNGVHHSLRNEAPAPPFELHAYIEKGRCYDINIEVGDTAIWEHRVTDAISVFHGERAISESIIFGRRDVHGNEFVLRLYPDGRSFEFRSLDAARGYQVT